MSVFAPTFVISKFTDELELPVTTEPPVMEITAPKPGGPKSHDTPVRIWSALLNPVGTPVEVFFSRIWRVVGFSSVNSASADSPDTSLNVKMNPASAEEAIPRPAETIVRQKMGLQRQSEPTGTSPVRGVRG